MVITLSEAENNCKQGIRNLSRRVDLALGILCVSDILIQFSAILILIIILILIFIINLILILIINLILIFIINLILILIINLLLILIINLLLILTRSSICFLFRLSFPSLGTGRTPGTRTLGWRSFFVYSVYTSIVLHVQPILSVSSSLTFSLRLCAGHLL